VAGSSAYTPPEVRLTYASDLRRAYRRGELFPKWRAQYSGHLLFAPRMLTSQQVPNGRPVRDAHFFHELLVGMLYIDAGYEAIVWYRKAQDPLCHRKLCELLGGADAGEFVGSSYEKGGCGPDLLVFHPTTGAFRFVECKGKTERYTSPQLGRFEAIERYLASGSHRHPPLHDVSTPDLFPPLAANRWIHVVRLVSV
jgi:hypothetical protein